jgi:hypothetical protein
MATDKQFEKLWTDKAKKLLVGRRIVDVQFMTEANAAQLGWSRRPVLLVLDDDNLLYASMDDEGNNGGSLFTNDESLEIIPSL